jgi:DNA polymerase
MSGRPAPTLAESIAAAHDWWREAGVDFTYHDQPAVWLADDVPVVEPVAKEPAAPAPAPRAPERPPVGGDRAGWPQDLAGFARWWLDEPSLDDGGLHPRVAPRCVAGAELLMLVTMPEAEDSETLLSGAHGRLLASFALAAGFAPDTVSVAAALPRHTAAPDWDGLAARGHGEILLHLLALAAPKRLIVLGRGILPLLRHDLPQGAPAVSELAIQGRSMPLLSTYAPENLLKSARERAGLWQRWLEWTDRDAQ